MNVVCLKHYESAILPCTMQEYNHFDSNIPVFLINIELLL